MRQASAARITREGGPKNVAKITKEANKAKISNQASDSSKNNNSRRRKREGSPTNITKIAHVAKISIGLVTLLSCHGGRLLNTRLIS